jgi:hypothetical protein
MSKREKVLVAILIIVGLGFGYFRFLYTPLVNEIQVLENKKIEKEVELVNAKAFMAKEGKFEKAYQENLDTLEKVISNYYLELYQEDYLIFIKELNDMENFQLNDFSFSDQSDQREAIEQLELSFEFEGDYEALEDYLYKIEKNNKYIAISELAVNSEDEGGISGEVSLNFMTIPALKAYIESQSIFDTKGTLVEKQFDSPFEKYASLLAKSDENEDNVLSNYVETREIDPVNNFIRKDMFFVGSDRSVSADIMTHPESLLGNNSILFDYDFGFKKNGLEANLVFEDEIIINESHEFLSVVAKAESINNHELGITLVDSYGKSHLLSLTSAIGSDEWEIYEVELPLDIVYPARAQRIYVRSTSNEQQIFGKLNIDGILLADTKEVAEEE